MRATVPFGVGAKYHYDGEYLTVVKWFQRDNKVLVTDRGGARRYMMSLRELLVNGQAETVAARAVTTRARLPR